MIGNYTTFLVEAFDQTKYVSAAEKWLKAKFKDKYEFVHKANLADPTKTYYVSVDGKHFGISGKKFDTTGDDELDTICYKIIPDEDEPETDETQEF